MERRLKLRYLSTVLSINMYWRRCYITGAKNFIRTTLLDWLIVHSSNWAFKTLTAFSENNCRRRIRWKRVDFETVWSKRRRGIFGVAIANWITVESECCRKSVLYWTKRIWLSWNELNILAISPASLRWTIYFKIRDRDVAADVRRTLFSPAFGGAGGVAVACFFL